MNEQVLKKRKKKSGRTIKRVLVLLLVLFVAVYAFWASGKLNFGFFSEMSGSQWYLTLVNSENAVPDDWTIEFTELKNGQRVDSRIYPYLQEMFDACRADGLLPVVMSSYRTTEKQQEVLDEKVSEYLPEGYSEEAAATCTK